MVCTISSSIKELTATGHIAAFACRLSVASLTPIDHHFIQHNVALSQDHPFIIKRNAQYGCHSGGKV